MAAAGLLAFIGVMRLRRAASRRPRSEATGPGPVANDSAACGAAEAQEKE
ncbi:hypothetical protein GCM10017559_04300 [Streptosporangium longisporum]